MYWIGAGSLARLGHLLDVHYRINWDNFREWVFHKYAKSYAPTVYCYAKKYAYVINGNLSDLDTLSESVRNQTIKSLITLSKYLGVHKSFKNRLDNYGIKISRPDAFSSFLRIFDDSSSDMMYWYKKATNVVRPNEKLFLRFVAVSGLRKSEAIQSFNLIVRLCENEDLQKYYNEELNCLQHFKFKKQFLRRTKNAYISFVPESLILEVAKSRPVAYAAIIKGLKRKNLRTRINELRDYYGTFMVRHGLIREEVDLLQGRIPPNIFIRHYWSPSFKELRDKTLKAVADLDKTL